jgi:hypothetical protein
MRKFLLAAALSVACISPALAQTPPQCFTIYPFVPPAECFNRAAASPPQSQQSPTTPQVQPAQTQLHPRPRAPAPGTTYDRVLAECYAWAEMITNAQTQALGYNPHPDADPHPPTCKQVAAVAEWQERSCAGLPTYPPYPGLTPPTADECAAIAAEPAYRGRLPDHRARDVR